MVGLDMMLLLISLLVAGVQAQTCDEESWLLPGNTPPLNPDCPYDGSLVPDCQHFLTDLTSYYHVHQYDCSKFWQCSPSGACLQSCPPCPPGACGDNSALSFDCRYQAPVGPVCAWPDSVACKNTPPTTAPPTTAPPTTAPPTTPPPSTTAPPTTAPPTTIPTPGSECPEGWEGHAENCYKYVAENKDWEDARESCLTEYQAELVSIHDEGESDFVLSFFTGVKFWTGAHRECDDCEAWLWSDGTAWDYSNWREGREPNNSTGPESCAEIGHYRDSWNDWKCPKSIHYMCKRGPLRCPDGWTENRGRCYQYVKERKTWAEAESFCNEREGHLVSVRDQEESDFIFSFYSGSKLWLGGRAVCSGCDDWAWTDGQQWSWTNWAGSEPNNSGGPEDCVELGHYASNRDQWNDWNCNNKLEFLCQRDKY